MKDNQRKFEKYEKNSKEIKKKYCSVIQKKCRKFSGKNFNFLIEIPKSVGILKKYHKI